GFEAIAREGEGADITLTNGYILASRRRFLQTVGHKGYRIGVNEIAAVSAHAYAISAVRSGIEYGRGLVSDHFAIAIPMVVIAGLHVGYLQGKGGSVAQRHRIGIIKRKRRLSNQREADD